MDFEDLLTNDLTNLESNINKLEIILISVNNYNIEKIDIIKKPIKDNILNKTDFIKLLKDITKDNNNYELKYILKFLLNFNIENLNDLDIKSNSDISKDNIYELSIIKKIEKLDFNNSFFNDTNSLILIMDKKQKLNIKKKKKKKNTTKKKYCN